MKIRKRCKTTLHWIVHPSKVKAEIKKNALLKSFLGHYTASSRVSGWGNVYGLIQIETECVDIKNAGSNTFYDFFNSIYTSYIYLNKGREEKNLQGWTPEHQRELENLCLKLKIIISKGL